MPERPSVESIFIEAIDLSGDEREALLNLRCGQDTDLRDAVENLIRADEQAGQGDFLESKLLGETTASDPAETSSRDESIAGLDRFRIMGAYREGGLGEVLIAHDRQLDRDVAVKQIKSQWKESLEARQRFIQEAKVTGRLEHPGIVPVYAMGTWPDGSHYYAMRFIEGDTMKAAIEEYHRHVNDSEASDDQQMRLRELLTRFIDVCQTIQYAHSKRVLHRDIKPSNIMVGPYGETLVVDWGLAKLLDDSGEDSMTADLARELAAGSGSTPTQVGGRIGTPQYMSPEQARGNLDDIGTRTDVYLLGATLYQILAGQPPHSGDTISQLLKRVGDGELTPPRELHASIPPPLQSICLKAMATDPADRYSDASQIADDVNRWLADQTVSVHDDSVAVRANRWMRRHRTATSTIAVATLLIAVGGVAGSILWNVANVRRLKAEEQSRAKEIELEIKDQQRVSELALAASTAEQLAEKEIARNRFSSARDILVNAIASIESEQELEQQAGRIAAKADRIGALVEFYELSEVCEQQNILSRDTKALMACTSGLKKLGIWDRADWWNALPRQDLSPQQFDTLCWDVYQQMMLMDAMLIKTMAVRLGGFSVLRVTQRMANTRLGKPEADAALILSDRLDRFRKSESSRLYRSFADFRRSIGPWIEDDQLMIPTMWLKGSELALPTNSADAHSLAVLSMIAAIDPKFGIAFHDYHSPDPLVASRDLYERAASLRPNYYGAHLGLGQVEYLLALKDQETLRWENLAPSLRAFSQCITLNPNRCFAFADRSSIYRRQAELILDDERYEPAERERRANERLQWSLADAERAMKFYEEHPWVGWQAGQSYAAVGQIDRAIDRWVQTGIDSYALGRIADSEFVAVDDLRGRAEIADWLENELLQSTQAFNRARAFVALAGIRLNQNRSNEALDAVEAGLMIDEDDNDARAVRAMSLLQENAYETARLDFETVYESDPQHPLAAFGLALCKERSDELAEALALHQIAEQCVMTAENRAAAAIGVFRTAAIVGDLETASKAIRRAIELEPATDLSNELRPVAAAIIRWKKTGEVPEDQIASLVELIQSLSELPRPTKIEPMPEADLSQGSTASLLNGGFELGSMVYWIADSGAHWESGSGVDSSARADSVAKRSGDWSLRIDSNSRADTIGHTGQSFSIVAGTPYELSCWIKADGISENGFRVESESGQTLISCSSGTYPWRRAVGSFVIDKDENGDPIAPGTVVETRVKLVASGKGTIWIDDVTCATRGSDETVGAARSTADAANRD